MSKDETVQKLGQYHVTYADTDGRENVFPAAQLIMTSHPIRDEVKCCINGRRVHPDTYAAMSELLASGKGQ